MPDVNEVINKNQIVRVNDGNDSNIDRELVVKSVQCYPLRFYNTSIPKDLEKFDAPVVLTLNPGKNTDSIFHKLSNVPKNLMFLRFRTNTWNIDLAKEAIEFYKNTPVVLTWMAYFETMEKNMPEIQKQNYVFRKRTLNSYWAITTEAWIKYMEQFRDKKNVYSCGHVEGENGDTKCKYCGNCIREFYSARMRMMESFMEEVGFTEGEKCNREGCDGIIDIHPSENCSCHISPPCYSCTSPRAFCPVCGLEEKYDEEKD